MYKKQKDMQGNVSENCIVKDGTLWIPNDPANKDWQEYQAWLALGNEPDPAD